MPKLIVVNRAAHQEKVYRLKQDQISIGRDDSHDIPLNERSISRNHAEIIYDHRDYYVVDLESGNGTLLNGRRIHPNERNLLCTNDIIGIPPFDIHFILGADDEREPSHFDDKLMDTDIIEIKMIKKMLRTLESTASPTLQVASGPDEGKVVTFSQSVPELTIGRDDSCGLILSDPSVSRVHAVLVRKWGGVSVSDLDSKNGTFVNAERIQEKLLKDGDQLVLGTVKILYRNPEDVSLSVIEREYAKDDARAQKDETPSPSSQGSPSHDPSIATTPHDASSEMHSSAATATTNPSDAPSDDALPDLFGGDDDLPLQPKTPNSDDAPSATDIDTSQAAPPRATSSTSLNTLLLYVLIGIGACIFLTALGVLVWLLMK